MNYEELQKKRQDLKNNTNITLNNIHMIADESNRVADVAHNAKRKTEDLDREFELQTGLSGADIVFLFIATALQCGRIFLINNSNFAHRF